MVTNLAAGMQDKLIDIDVFDVAKNKGKNLENIIKGVIERMDLKQQFTPSIDYFHSSKSSFIVPVVNELTTSFTEKSKMLYELFDHPKICICLMVSEIDYGYLLNSMNITDPISLTENEYP